MLERMIALKRIPYNRKTYAKGEHFLATPYDARTLVLFGVAARAPDNATLSVASAPTPPTPTPPPPAEQQPAPAAEPAKRKRGRPRKYERRDMLAKE